MRLVNHGAVQRDARSLVTLPVESSVDDDRLGDSPCVIAEILRQIFLLIADYVTEHFICPAYFSGDGFCIRIEEKFRTVEAQSAFRIVRTGDAETVQLSGPHIRQKHVPDLIGVFSDRDTNVFFRGLETVEQTKLNAGGVLGKNGEVDAVAHPRRPQRIWITEESPYRSHKRAAHLCGIASSLAITNTGIDSARCYHVPVRFR